MITRDAETFVALARAVTLAHAEGALDDGTVSDLSAALVAGLLTGCMEMDTYGKVHDALALLLEKAFEGPARQVSAEKGTPEEPLGMYLEVVVDAWDKVASDDEPFGGLTTFVRRSFDLRRARFGEDGWFRAPVKTDLDSIVRQAKTAGLLLISREGSPPREAEAVLQDPASKAGAARLILGWGDRRTALDLVAAEKA